MAALGQQAIISIVSHLIFIVITWYGLQALPIEKVIRKGRVFEARLLLILLTITIGSTVSNFFLDFLFWSKQIPYLLP
ncbi:DUF1146 family protein [Bacillus sp. FJAT-47783]|uniref:DUF1146 family protein n=1 Tax=Bacillus sp. FJAT-47783 TaxID=2922712 RepID=UPI001FACD8AC|nr:DUF1146 family protein [Bacillus sp. FJAT-47783]